MGQLIDISGRRFGLFVVLGRAPSNSKYHCALWLVRCDCGAERHVPSRGLLNGSGISCGCRKPGKKHGHSLVGDKPTLTYTSWQRMRQRCENQNAPDFKRYGARGITVCERWKDFQAFLSDMGERPSKEFTLDRINNDGSYEPNNCRWASKKVQANNRRKLPPATHCKYGHLRAEFTTYSESGHKHMWCRECARLRARARYKNTNAVTDQ